MTMQIHLLKGKLHRALVTDANVEYEGSLTIDHDLMDKVSLLPFERVVCGNMANGNRFETYAIPGKRGSGDIVLNGATAHLGHAGDRLTIMFFGLLDEKSAPNYKPRIIVLGEDNAVIEDRNI
jgi:aspartate 1-decarboxylase